MKKEDFVRATCGKCKKIVWIERDACFCSRCGAKLIDFLNIEALVREEEMAVAFIVKRKKLLALLFLFPLLVFTILFFFGISEMKNRGVSAEEIRSFNDMIFWAFFPSIIFVFISRKILRNYFIDRLVKKQFPNFYNQPK